MKNTIIIQDLLDDQSFQDWASTSYDPAHKFCQTQAFKDIDQDSLSIAKLLFTNVSFKTDTIDLSVRSSILKSVKSSIVNENLETTSQHNVVKSKRALFSYAMWSGVAASLLILLMFTISSPFDSSINLRTDYAEVLTETLPDGSVVSLDANSSISSVGKWSGSNDRVLQLTNDAFFSVTNEPKVGGSAFIVLTKYADIEVLGTEFYVENKGASLRVVVKEGSVRVSSNKSSNFESQILEAGDELIITNGQELQSSKLSSKDIVNSLAWAEGKLIFDQTSWSDLEEIVKEKYGYNLDIHPALYSSNRTITGSFPNKSIELLMKSIASTFELQIGYKDSTISIDYKKKD